jgi:hypothetical protein
MTVSKSEESESQTHAARSYKIKFSIMFLLYKNAPHKHWDEFAALEDHLCRVIEVPQ